jgi:hypothetical protein
MTADMTNDTPTVTKVEAYQIGFLVIFLILAIFGAGVALGTGISQ